MTANFLKKINLGLILILAGSFIFKAVYIFYLTDYSHYLFDDMGTVWGNALDRLAGHSKSIMQYSVFPIFYPLFLSFLLFLLKAAGLFQHRLEVIILLNVILSTVSAYWVYRITENILPRTAISLIVACVYGFCYPVIYFNGLILAENIAIPFLIGSVFLVLEYFRSRCAILAAGMLLGMSIASRPLLFPIFLPFFIYLISVKVSWRSAVQKCAWFSLGLAGVIALVCMENGRISDGRVMGLGPHGGVNIFMSYCRPHQVISTANGGLLWAQAASSFGEKDREVFTTDQPFYNQVYFLKLAENCIRENPSIFLEKFLELPKLYFSMLTPQPSAVPKPFGYHVLLWIHQIFFIVISVPFVFFAVLPWKGEERRKIFLLAFIVLAYLASIYLIGMPERRFLYSVDSLIYIVSFVSLYKLYQLTMPYFHAANHRSKNS